MLGRDIVAAFKPMGEAISASRSGGDIRADITDAESLRAALDDTEPDLVINSAAWVDVDAAESHPDETFRVNAWGAWNAAAVAASYAIPVLHISTDYVFDGLKGAPYTEFDRTNPVNVYGASKLAGEEAILWLGAPVWIVRTQWLYGGAGDNFVTAVLSRAEKGEPIRAVDDQFGTPTYTPDVAAMLRTIVSEAPYGIYHVNNAGGCSRHAFARAILEISGRDPGLAEAVPSAAMARPAPRPGDRKSVV